MDQNESVFQVMKKRWQDVKHGRWLKQKPSSLRQLHADTGTELDASMITGQERGLRYCCRIPFVSLERLHVAFDTDPEILNSQ